MAVYVLKPEDFTARLKKEKIGVKIEGVTECLKVVFQERSSADPGKLNFPICTEEAMQAVIGDMDEIIKKRARSDIARTRKQCAINIRGVFMEGVAAYQESVAQGKPSVVSPLDTHFALFLAKKLG